MDLNDRISRSSLHIEVADRVREMIFDRTLPAGCRIDELDLSAKLGTSRTPLREALKVLANEGLVRLAPGRGAYVTELSPQEVDALFPVLALLEARGAGEAVRRQTAADARRLEAVHQRMEEHVAAGDCEAYHQATDELHQLLHTIAGNPWLLRATADLRRFLRLARSMARNPDARVLQSLAEHRTLMKTIARGDADSAEQVMHHHLLAQQKAWRAELLQASQSQARGATEARQEQPAPAATQHADGSLVQPSTPAPRPSTPAAHVLTAPVEQASTRAAQEQEEAESLGV
jgi:DNA-binding GntR family transcriptional regulator